MTDHQPTRRYHALDSLRAGAMLLGLVLHAGVSYTRECPQWWAHCDSSQSGMFDLLNTTIHAFRMQVFFLMSGFFAHLLIHRVGFREFMRRRRKLHGFEKQLPELECVFG